MANDISLVSQTNSWSTIPGLPEFLHFERILTARGETREKLLLCIKELVDVLAVGGVIMRYASKDRRSLKLFGWAGWAITEPPSSSTDVDQWFSGTAYKLGKPLIVNDYPSHRLADQRYVASGARSLAALPVKGGKGPIGAMLLYVDKSAHFNLPRIRFLTAVVGIIGMSLENLLLEHEQGTSRSDKAPGSMALSMYDKPMESDAASNLDLIGRRLTTTDSAIKLTAIEASLLTLLASNRGQVVTYEEILHAVWGPEYEAEREYVRVFVGRLRKKLGGRTNTTWAIENVPRIGYKLP